MSIAHYLLQVNIYLVVFYGFYKLLLDKETYFTLNRIYLVSAGVLSLAIPFLRFEWFTKQEAIQPVYISVGQLMGQVSIVQEAPSSLNAGNFIVLVYITGILFFSVRLIAQLIAVNRKLKQKENGTAFSFFLKKRIDASLPQVDTIHKHEDTHMRQWHSMDVLFFELLSIFTWFNPIIYFYKDAIKSIHEYLADEEAAKFQGDKEQYALLLLSSAFRVPVNTLTNSFFNKSLIKKRIFMLHKQRSHKIAVLKYGLFIPLFAIALIMSSATIRSNEKIQEIADNIPLNTPVEAVTEVVKESIKPITPQRSKKTEIINEEPIQPLAGWEEFYTFMKKSLRYPPIAHQEKIQGTTMLKFTIAGGQLENIGIATKLGGGCDAEAMRALASFSGYKSIQDGKYTINIDFRLEGANTPLQNEKIEPIKGYTALNKITLHAYFGPASASSGGDNDEKVYDFTSLDTAPSFPGGMQKLYEYLSKTVRYPKEAQENNIQGKVFLSFIVETDGALTGIKVEKKLGSGTDEEAIRVLKESPKWNPGLVAGNAVRVKYHLPMVFSLSTDEGVPTRPQNKKEPAQPAGQNMGIRFKSENGAEVKFGAKPEHEPLYILDGKPIDAATMATLDPNNIEAIDVLKSASATALYGLKGVNGVILITTKTGKWIEKTGEAKEKKEK
ncbi:TonB family protein [Pedobacter nyackensis]|uniref:TonB family protein n=1 Tax=Pedobacter nyackensis TaxID=475255 RepID=UPI00292DADF1|nr:TonB family protein [Pedobacter nyackensis]